MKKLFLLFLLSLSLIGCSNDSEKESELEFFQDIKVEGVCWENHTNTKENYDGLISVMKNLSDNTMQIYGGVSLKDNSILFPEFDESTNLYEYLYRYIPPYEISFIGMNNIDNETILKPFFILKGISNLDSEFHKDYASTCSLNVLERQDNNLED